MYFQLNLECCTQIDLIGFGEEVPTFDGEHHKSSPSASDFPTFVKRLREKATTFDKKAAYCSGTNQYKKLAIHAFILATTLDTQPIAEGFLKEFGFKKAGGPYSRTKYNFGKVSVWLISIADFFKKLEKHETKLGIKITQDSNVFPTN